MSWSEWVKKLVLGDPHSRKIKSYLPIVEKIGELEAELKGLSDIELKGKTADFRLRLANKSITLDNILPEAFAVVREAGVRSLGMRHFDVQLMGGIALHQGNIAEMKTGEGKTLMSTLPAYLNALEGKGVYIVTVNDYLAKRDSQWMGKVFHFLGLSVGLIQNSMSFEERRLAYECDITYGTNNEFGFDYLRDNLAMERSQVVQSRRNFAVIDEVDSILIDEARTPLIISGPIEESTAQYIEVAKQIRFLEKDTHFELDEKHKNVVLTEPGIHEIEKLMGIQNMYSVETMSTAHMVVNCLKALHLYNRDVDYVVKDGEVVIVDEFTGRLMDGRRYSDGLHQAIEAIEKLDVREESQTLASITFQNYFRLFPKLSGMTGTAQTEEEEFIKIYNLAVVPIPTNQEMIRKDQGDFVYKNKAAKQIAIVKTIKEIYQTGQPVLVGTISIEASELLSRTLSKEGVPHTVLNAKYHEKEAEIISQAGQKNGVTIATNMAGRGTDIVLGEGVKELGGLFVLGTERHESRRIDNQLRGRSGRQGDPGESRFFVSLEDDLMRLFGSDRIIKIMDTLGLPDDVPIEHGMVSRSIEKAQKKVEQYYFGVRKQVLQYDDVVNRQRETIYTLRDQLLKMSDLEPKVHDLIDIVIKNQTQGITDTEKLTDEWILGVGESLFATFPINDLGKINAGVKNVTELKKRLSDQLMQFYRYRKSEYPPSLFDELITRRVLLQTVDRKWRDQIHNLDVLREGIGLRAWGQKDPLIEYKVEAFEMFQILLLNIAEEALSMICRMSIVGLPEKE